MQIKNQDDLSRDIGLQEGNSIFDLWKQLKKSIFNVLFVLLDQSENEEDQSVSGMIIQTGIDYIQMMAFPFNWVIIGVWNGGESLDNFSSIVSNLNVSQLMPGVGFKSFLVMLYALIFLIILVILDIVYVSYAFTKKKFKYTFPLVFLAKVVPLCVTVFSQPILQTLLSVVNCQASQDDPNIQVMQNYPEVVCWQSWHMFHSTITLFFTMIFVFISGIVALTIFQPRMTTNRLTARQNSTGQVVFIVNKMFCQFFFSFTPFSQTWIYCVMLFVLSGWLYVKYNFYDPYYNKTASKFFRIISTYYFWTNLMLMVGQLLMGYDFHGCLVIWLCGLPFIGISIVFQKKSNINKLFSSNLKFKSGQQLQSHLQYVLQLIQNRQKDNNSHMLLIGYIQKHIQICVQEDCPLKAKRLKKQQQLSDIEESCKKLIKQLERMYIQGIKKYPTCTRLHLSFAFFHMERLKNNRKAYQQFTLAQSTDPSFGQQFIIYRFKKIIRQNLEEQDQDDDTDLIEIISFDNYVSLCQQAMLLSARLHKDFWALLEQQIPDLQILNSLGSKITQTTQIIKQNYEQIQKINQHVPEIIHNYSMYLIFVGQKVESGKKSLDQAYKIYKEKKLREQNDVKIFALKNEQYTSLKQLDNSNNAIIKISASADTLGRISYINDGFTQLTGYLKQDISERCIDKILPQIFQKYHLQAIKNWLNCEQKMYLNKNNKYMSQSHKSFIRQKNGFLLPIVYRVSFDVQENCFMAILRSDPCCLNDFNYKIYIFTNPIGIVRDISQLGYAYFNLSKQNISNTQFNVEQLGLIPPLNRDELALNTITQIKLRSLKRQNILKAQKTIGVRGKTLLNLSNNQNQLNKQQPEDDFLLKLEQVWILSNQDYTQSINDKHQYLDGRVKIGYVYYLERVQSQTFLKQNQIKHTQLNVFEEAIDNMFFDERDLLYSQLPFQEAQKQRKVKILAEMLKQMGQTAFDEQMFTKKFRDYGRQAKIKTYRYFQGEMTRLYDVQYENSESQDGANQNQQKASLNEIKRLQNQHYKHKLITAINTQIQYFQIKFLRYYSLFFLLGVFVISIFGVVEVQNQFSEIETFNFINSQRSNNSDFILNILQTAADSQSNKWNSSTNLVFFNQISNKKINFNPDQKIYCIMENGELENKNIHDVLVLIYSRVLNFFNPQSLNPSLQTTFTNFYNYVYPVLQGFSQKISLQFGSFYILLGLSILNGLFMILVWIYSTLKMNQKRFDIMIWFLDIPAEYVNYLGINCTKFLKGYIPIKELEEKGISQTQQYYIDEYVPKQDNGYQDLDEGNKARKILIARHIKKTLFSHFQLSYLKVLWILVYSSFVISLLLIFASHVVSIFSFVNQQWQLVQKQHLWSNSLSLTLTLGQAGYTNFNNISLTSFGSNIQQNFLNTLTKTNNVETINQLLDFDSGVSSIYSQIYYQNLCLTLKSMGKLPQMTNSSDSCQNVLEGILKGGFQAYSIYLTNYNKNQIKILEQAQFNYISPAFMLIFSTWSSYVSNNVSSYLLYSELIAYFFLAFSLICFLIVWLIHLREENIKMNQTVQMLNMIPIQMFPKQRKATITFLDWIINEASKVRHEQQDLT